MDFFNKKKKRLEKFLIKKLNSEEFANNKNMGKRETYQKFYDLLKNSKTLKEFESKIVSYSDDVAHNDLLDFLDEVAPLKIPGARIQIIKTHVHKHWKTALLFALAFLMGAFFFKFILDKEEAQKIEEPEPKIIKPAVKKPAVKKNLTPPTKPPPFRKSLIPQPPVKRKFVPHYDIKLNKSKWGTAGFAHTLRRECGDCKRLCGTLKHDKGGLTCGGFSIRSNPDLFSKIINAEFQKCIKRGIYTPPGSNDAFGEVKDTCYFLRQAYWERYIKFFKGCTWNALCLLGDISILQGPGTATKLLQRSHGLQVDGVFGSQSVNACSKENFSIEALNNARVAAVKTYKDFKHFENGWLSRMEKSYKFCKGK